MVGAQQEQFTVHQDMICDRSPFFKAACSKGWVEHEARKVNLPDESPEIFQAYLDWAYSQTKDIIRLLKSPDSLLDSMLDFAIQQDLRLKLCRLWILADYLGDSTCKNEVMNNLISLHAKPRLIIVRYSAVSRVVYERTGNQSKLRKWLVDTLVPMIDAKSLHMKLWRCPADFMMDMFQAFVQKAGPVGRDNFPKATNAARYYE